MAGVPTIVLPSRDELLTALSRVNDPEIRKPITELGMVKSVEVDEAGRVAAAIFLTVAGCPMKETLTRDVTTALTAVSGVSSVDVTLDVMSEEQRAALRTQLRGGQAEREIPFARPGSLTRVYAVASGKGGVGKSSVTVNLAASMAASGLRVGVVDADVYGFSVPRMLGVTQRPTQVDDMILPPIAHDVKVISIGMFVPGNQPVVWRGPMLHRALQQFLGDVFWGDLDVLLLDLPPGTGDIAISVAQLIPNAEILVVTTPQQAAAEVAERAGAIALQTHQRLVGVVENMSWLELPDGSRQEIFGSGGGQAVSDSLTRSVGAPVPLLGQIPLDTRLREGGDSGMPVVLGDPDSAGGGGAPSGGARALDASARPGGTVPGPHARRPLTPTSLLVSVHDRWPSGDADVPMSGESARHELGGVGVPGRRLGRVVERLGYRSHHPGLRLLRLVGRFRRRVLHQRLAHDPARVVLAGVELAPVDVLELGTHLVLQLGPRVRREVADLTDHVGELPGILRQPFRPEHEDADDDEEDQLPAVHVQHLVTSAVVPGSFWGQLGADCRVIVTSVV